MKFLLLTINGTSTFLATFSFMAFLIYSMGGHAYTKAAFIAFVVNTTLCFVTPSREELFCYWIKTEAK